jgi:hypothetical protein
MYETVASIEVTPAAAAAGHTVGVWVQEADPDALCVDQLRAELGLLERVRGQIDALTARHGLALRAKAPHAAVRTGEELGLSGREQRRRAKVADAAAKVPGAAAALAAGEVNAEHLETLGS